MHLGSSRLLRFRASIDWVIGTLHDLLEEN